MENYLTLVPVVAVAMIHPDGRVLMQKRAAGKEHGGLWEFPGGKIEPGESPKSAIVREIIEELGIVLDEKALVAHAWAGEDQSPNSGRGAIVILLYTCRSWSGNPVAQAGEEIAWFESEALGGLAMPPLDYQLAEAVARSK